MTEKKTDAWMPLWIGAYLADTQMLTTQQHGAYLLLLMAYWRERSALPDDDDALRSIAKADRAEWKKLRPALVRFFKVGDGVWWHKRVEAEIAEADKRKAGAVGKAQAAAAARWKDRPEHPQSTASGNAPSTLQAMPEECPTPSPPLPAEEKKARKRAAPEIPCPEDVDPETWGDWVRLRKGKSATVSNTVVSEARKEAAKAGMTLGRFLAVWCLRGSQGLQASWLKTDEGAKSFRQADTDAKAAEVRAWTGGQLDKLADNIIDMEAPRAAQIGNR